MVDASDSVLVSVSHSCQLNYLGLSLSDFLSHGNENRSNDQMVNASVRLSLSVWSFLSVSCLTVSDSQSC